MENELRELSKTYEECLAVQEKVIAAYNKRLKTARQEFNMKEVARLNALMRVLYDEKMELQLTAHQIRKYLS